MPPAARITDNHVCPMVTGVVPHVGGPIIPPCEPTVLIGYLPAARITDKCICTGPPDVILKGSPTVLIGYLQAARIGDPTVHGGVIVTGEPTVIIGEAGGPAGPFPSRDAAARAALEIANPLSIHHNLEFGGLIYEDPSGQFFFTGPIVGGDQGVNPQDAPAPANAQVVGDFHTHADYSEADPVTGNAVRTSDPTRDDFNSDNFSDADRLGIAADGSGNPEYRGYLGTPSGTFRVYDPATGADSEF
jgi:uncharacterized Zn-binding protein involved in type VI secretion